MKNVNRGTNKQTNERTYLAITDLNNRFLTRPPKPVFTFKSLYGSSGKRPFSSPEAELLKASNKNRDLWSSRLTPRFTDRDSHIHPSAIHGLPVTLWMLRIKSDKSDWLRIQKGYFAQAQKITPNQRSPILDADPMWSSVTITHEQNISCIKTRLDGPPAVAHAVRAAVKT